MLTRRQFVNGFAAASLARIQLFEGAALADEAPESLIATLEPLRKQGDLPALAAVVWKNGKVVGSGATGFRKYGDPIRVTLKDQFHLGSCTKAMTATLCGILQEEGKVDWSTTLATAFPDLAYKMQPSFRSVTLDHLLSHRSGFSEVTAGKNMSLQVLHNLPGSTRKQRETYLVQILSENPIAMPGEKYVYSNRNFIAAGAILERVANSSWEELIARRLFKPLGMKSAGFGAMGTPGKTDQPWQHILDKQGERRLVEPGPHSDNPPLLGPAGTVHCSLEDWGLFVTDHIRGLRGEKGIMKRETYDHLHKPLFGGDYAGGWIATDRGWGGGRVYTHSGSNTQNFAVVWMAPIKNFAVLIATNQGGDSSAPTCDKVAGALIQRYLS